MADAELAPLLERFQERHGVPAVVGGVVDGHGALRSHVTGTTHRDPSATPVTVEDRWHIGSCGKSITAVLWARLVEGGLAEWGMPIRSLFPDIDVQHAGWSEPTIDDLLRCRAGVAPNPPRRKMKQLWDCTIEATEQRTRAAKSVLSEAPHQPGRFRYSNLGYVLAGAAIERIAGAPFEQSLQGHVLEPLGVQSAGFGPPERVRGHRSRLQLGPVVIGRGTPMNPDNPRSDNPALLTPAGRLHITIADWGAFQRVFLEPNTGFLTDATIEHLLEVPSDGRNSMAMGWVQAAGPGLSYGMQGSNTMWAATALLDRFRERSAMVVTNDGRSTVLRASAELAASLLAR